MEPKFFNHLEVIKRTVLQQQGVIVLSCILLIVPVVGSGPEVVADTTGDKIQDDTLNNYSSGNVSKKHGHGLTIAAIAYHEVRDPLIFTIVVLLAGISKIVYHHSNFLSSIVPESCILIILGTVFGAVIHFSGISKNLPEFFKPHEFFIFLLPPIILEAAFSLHDRAFTENFGSILLFAVLGTVLACSMLGATLFGLAKVGAMGQIADLRFMEIMVFSSLIVAVDPVAVLAVFNEIGVNHVLYFIVFGESLLNDGVTVVLYKVFQAYNLMDVITGEQIIIGIVKFFVVCLGGLALGILAGIASAILTKFSTHVKVAQPIIIFTMAYFGFLMAELFEFSGIISIIGCGLIQMQYAFHNISDKSRTTIKYFTKVISSANEIIIFLFLGLSLVNEHHEWHTGFTLWTIIFCLIYRFIIVFSMSCLINWLDIFRVRKISLHEQFMIAYGGLRGAVCFSLVALLDPEDLKSKNMFVTTTLAVIVFTVFVQGITIKPLVHLFRISLAPKKSPSMYEELNSHVTDHLMAAVEDIIGDHGRNHLRERLGYLDGKYLKPLLQVTNDPGDCHIRVFFEHLLLKEHYNHLKLSGAKPHGDIPKLPHVNTELLLSTLSGAHNYMQELPVLEETEVEPQPESDCSRVMSAPVTPVITIEMDNDDTLLRQRRSHRSMSAGEGDIDALGLRSLLMFQKNNRLTLSMYDKNLTSPENIHTAIYKKTHRNKGLQRFVSQEPLLIDKRRKSWSDTDAQVCEERSKQSFNVLPRHAKTVDFGNSGQHGTFDPLSSSDDESFSVGSPFSVGSLLGSVFEDEEGVESLPMLSKTKATRPSVKSKLERQMGIDVARTGGQNSLPEQDQLNQPIGKSKGWTIGKKNGSSGSSGDMKK